MKIHEEILRKPRNRIRDSVSEISKGIRIAQYHTFNC